MYNKKIFKLLIILIVLLSSITVYLFIQSKKADGVLNRKISEESIFDQKQVCAKYKLAIERKLEESNSTNGIFFLRELFFSQKRNSCLYTVSAILTSNNKVTSLYELTDYLSNEKLVTIQNEDVSIASQIFEKEIAKYR